MGIVIIEMAQFRQFQQKQNSVIKCTFCCLTVT